MNEKTIELKYPIKTMTNKGEVEIKYLTAGRLKVKHFELLPVSIFDKATKKEDGSYSFDIENISMNELIPIFKELIPFIAGICNISVDVAKDIDFEDITNVMELFVNAFPEVEKKN